MSVKFGLTDSTFNTQYAPLGMLLALYKQKQVWMAKTPPSKEKVIMNQDWTIDEIIEYFTLLPSEIAFLGSNDPHNH